MATVLVGKLEHLLKFFQHTRQPSPLENYIYALCQQHNKQDFGEEERVNKTWNIKHRAIYTALLTSRH